MAGNQIVYWNGKEFIITGRLQLLKKSFHESEKFPTLIEAESHWQNLISP